VKEPVKVIQNYIITEEDVEEFKTCFLADLCASIGKQARVSSSTKRADVIKKDATRDIRNFLREAAYFLTVKIFGKDMRPTFFTQTLDVIEALVDKAGELISLKLKFGDLTMIEKA
jgi:hydrogenase maturation factor HypE